MENARRFFRYDVEIPIYLQTLGDFDHTLKKLREVVLEPEEEVRLGMLDKEILIEIDELFIKNTQTANVFYTLNKRLKFIHWILDRFMDLEDPREDGQFSYRLREDHRLAVPKAGRSEKLRPLIENFFFQTEDVVEELVQVAETSIDGKLFLFQSTQRLHFDVNDYVNNLEKLVQKGVLLAKVLMLLVEKFNLLVDVLNRLKVHYRPITHSSFWPERRVNLSAGGCSFLTDVFYEKFSRFHVFMKLDDEVVVCEGRMVMVREVNEGAGKFLVGLEFEFIPFETQKSITLFVQLRELKDTMVVYPEVLLSPLEDEVMPDAFS